MSIRVIISVISVPLFLLGCNQKESGTNDKEVQEIQSLQGSGEYYNFRQIDSVPTPVWMQLADKPLSYDSIPLESVSVSQLIFDDRSIAFSDKEGALEREAITKTVLTMPTDSVNRQSISLVFDGHVFLNIEDSVYLQSIDLRTSEKTLRYNKIKFDSAFTKKKASELFPVSYSWRNWGVTWVPSTIEPSQSKKFSFITIKIPEMRALMRLNFLNDSLFFVDFVYDHK